MTPLQKQVKTKGQATGFNNIDLKMGGIDGLAVLGARPGMGKTAFALNVAEHIVYNELKPVVFFSLWIITGIIICIRSLRE